jgi:hypothetical protein
MRFVAAGGTAVIASLTEVVQAMNGEAGTRIVPEAGTDKRAQRSASDAAKKAAGKARGKKADSKKAPGKKSAARQAARPGATVTDISEARKRASGGRA